MMAFHTAPPPDVHEALSDHVKAYSVFKPHPDLPPLQAVMLNPDRSARHKSPCRTNLNLKELLDHALRLPRMAPPNHLVSMTNDMRRELNRITKEEYDYDEFEVSVSTASLLRILASATIPEAGVSVGARMSRERGRDVSLKLLPQQSKRYAGSDLLFYIWDHAEFFLKRILVYLHTELGLREGDRRLLAFITKEIQGRVSISMQDYRNLIAGLTAPASFMAGFGRAQQSRSQCKNLSGVIGVHFIVFPTEKTGHGKWRFYLPIHVVDDTSSGTDNLHRFRVAEQWARGEPGVRLTYSDGSKDVNMEEDIGDRSCNSETQVPSPTSSSSGDGEHKSISLSRPIRDSVDIDINDNAEEFALQQYILAENYMRMRSEKLETDEVSLGLLKSAAELGNPQAQMLLEAFKSGIEAWSLVPTSPELRKYQQFSERPKQEYTCPRGQCTPQQKRAAPKRYASPMQKTPPTSRLPQSQCTARAQLGSTRRGNSQWYGTPSKAQTHTKERTPRRGCVTPKRCAAPRFSPTANQTPVIFNEACPDADRNCKGFRNCLTDLDTDGGNDNSRDAIPEFTLPPQMNAAASKLKKVKPQSKCGS